MPKQRRQHITTTRLRPPPRAHHVSTPCIDDRPTTQQPEVNDTATSQQPPPPPPPPPPPQPRDTITITIRTLTGRATTLVVQPTDCIGNIKERYEVLEGIPKTMQRLIFAGRALEDHRTIEDYQISDWARVHMVLSMGMKRAL